MLSTHEHEPRLPLFLQKKKGGGRRGRRVAQQEVGNRSREDICPFLSNLLLCTEYQLPHGFSFLNQEDFASPSLREIRTTGQTRV